MFKAIIGPGLCLGWRPAFRALQQHGYGLDNAIDIGPCAE